MAIELKFHHFGCDSCKKEFPKGKVPQHKLQGFDFGSKGVPFVEWTCEGSGKQTTEWFAKWANGHQLTGMVRKDWKPKPKKTRSVS